MASNYNKDDIRVRKTDESLISAMFTLLNTHKFGKISVNEICEEALVSRTTFYSHFIDKYSLLQYSFDLVLQRDFSACTESNIIAIVNDYIMANEKMIKNIVEDADDATLELLQKFIEYIAVTAFGHSDAPVSEVLSTFYTGGIISLLKWQVKNKFPADIKLMSENLCDVLKYIMEPRSSL